MSPTLLLAQASLRPVGLANLVEKEVTTALQELQELPIDYP